MRRRDRFYAWLQGHPVVDLAVVGEAGDGDSALRALSVALATE